MKYYLQKTQGTRLGTAADLPAYKIGSLVPVYAILTKDGKWVVKSDASMPLANVFDDIKAAKDHAKDMKGVEIVSV